MSNLNISGLKEELKNIVEDYQKRNVFSGCCISFLKNDDDFEKGLHYAFGHTTKFETKTEVTKKTYFDLASLTKPLVTALSIAVLIERGKIDLQDTLSVCPGWCIPNDKKNIKIAHLLSHSSGFPAHRPYYQKLFNIPCLKKKETLRNWILDEKMCFLSGTDTLYSDLGFILLGFLVEDLTGLSLDHFWLENVIAPQGLQKGLLFPKNRLMAPELCAATKNCHKEEDLFTGVVHDYNCRAMGGVGGHAGLFGTGSAVVSLCGHILGQCKGRIKHSSYSYSTITKLLKRRSDSNWSYGFDIPTEGNSSSGLYFSNTSRGHLGFTGTSFWIDFERDLVIVILTNRVHLSNNTEGIRAFRPLIHDTIMKKIINKKIRV